MLRIRLALPVAVLLATAVVPVPGQVPPADRAMRLRQSLMNAAPAIAWSPEGLLIVSRDSARSFQAMDPRTGAERPSSPPASLQRQPLRVVRPGIFAHVAPVREVPSPDGQWFAATREGNLWVRSAGSDEGVRLTTDGRPGHGFDVEGAKWSPDGAQLAVRWLDAREVPTIPLVRWSEDGEPVARHPYSRAGEPIPRVELFVVERESGRPTRIDVGEGDAPYVHVVGWSRGGDELWFTRMSRLMDRLDLLAADPATGQSRTILSETSATFIVGLPFMHGYTEALEALNHIVSLEDGRRFIWTSERDGWRRLYLHELDGTLIRALTPGGSEVERLEAVDEKRGWVYYTARVDPERPYDVALMRARLDGGPPETIVIGPAFHGFELDPVREFFWVRRAGVDQPPVLELRAADGTLVRELWSGESVAREAGWTPPEQVRAKAADGATDLFGLLFKPRDFDPARKYPVVDFLYLGSHTMHVPRSMVDRDYGVSQALADLGFIVLMVDARGTPGRGKAFHDAFHGEFGRHEIDDHAAVLRQLAAERPFMNLERVGAFGHSMGGYGVLRALLLAPDLYRVGVASSPAVDLEDFRVWVEPYMGCLPRDCPQAYQQGSSTALAERLQGKLLLLHGTSDDDVPFGETVRFVDALHRAGKPYDAAIFPEAHHILQGPYWWQRVTSYLREHLQR